MNGAAFDRAGVARLVPLLREICDLKRVYVAHAEGSLAERGFRRAWARLIAGEPPRGVALSETAACVAAARLSGLDREMLVSLGLDEVQAAGVMRASIAEHASIIGSALHDRLTDAVGEALSCGSHPLPPFVEALCRQPRAGATRPGRARIVLEPAENHAEHCYVTAVFAVLAGPCVGLDDVGEVFLAALAHHLHNAAMPDGGFAGETLLGAHLEPIMERATDAALVQLDEALARRVAETRTAVLVDNSGPAGTAFQIADVLDRVLQIEHFATVAAFRLADALDDLDLVHAGPLQAMQHDVLLAAGLTHRASRQPDQRSPAAA